MSESISMVARPGEAPHHEAHAATLVDLIKRRAEGAAVAIAAPGQPPLTYGSLLSRVETAVARLRAFGLGRTDRVAIVLPNGPEMAVCFVAVSAVATCAPLNPAYRAAEFAGYLSDLRPKALLLWSDLESPAREAAATLNIPVLDVIPMVDRGAGAFELRGERGLAANVPDGLARASDTALVLPTSGTTSRPKLVPLTHANICASGHNISLSLRLTSADRCLNVMPLFHIHGLIGALVASLAAGSAVICPSSFETERFFEWLDVCRPTWYTAVPTIHQAILARAPAHRGTIARRPLRFIRSCSAPLPPRVAAQLESVFNTQVIAAYGMTEASHQITSSPLAPLPRKEGSVGVATGTTVAIMDESDQLLPPGQTGEVVLRGYSVTAGYENDPDANASAFIDGWFRTGDLGHLDDEGYLFLSGRLKEIINRGGEKIAPYEVDAILSQHPAVAQALAFPVPHPTLGEDIAAAVVLEAGATATPADIRAFAAARLAAFKVPQRLVFLDEIPKGPTGKPQRTALAAPLVPQPVPRRPSPCGIASSSAAAALVDLWRQLLRLDDVAIRDNFFLLGGDSLTMATMLLEVEERFGRSISLDAFLGSPTIETIVQTLGAPASSSGTASPPPGGDCPARLISDSPLRGLRNRLLQFLALYAPGSKTTRVWLHRLRGVAIGRNVSIGLSSLIETAYPELVSIGSNVTIGIRAVIIAHLRDLTLTSRVAHHHTVRIDDDVYIGPGVIVLPHVTVGRGAVVSAGSVVTTSVPPRTLVRGNPATHIAHCGVSLGGGVSYQQFVRQLRPVVSKRSSPLATP